MGTIPFVKNEEISPKVSAAAQLLFTSEKMRILADTVHLELLSTLIRQLTPTTTSTNT